MKGRRSEELATKGFGTAFGERGSTAMREPQSGEFTIVIRVCASLRLDSAAHETQAWHPRRLLHQYPSRRKLAGNFRKPRTLHARGEGAGLPGQTLCHWAAPERPGVARAFGQSDVACVPTMARSAQLLHFHDQRISLWPISWRACQGTGLC